MANGKPGTKQPTKPNDDWEEISSTPIRKFENEGEDLVGIFLRYVDGKYGQLAEIKTEDGSICKVPLDTVLASRLGPDLIGKEVKILFLGWAEPMAGGKEYKDYKVYSRKPKF